MSLLLTVRNQQLVVSRGTSTSCLDNGYKSISFSLKCPNYTLNVNNNQDISANAGVMISLKSYINTHINIYMYIYMRSHLCKRSKKVCACNNVLKTIKRIILWSYEVNPASINSTHHCWYHCNWNLSQWSIHTHQYTTHNNWQSWQ